MRGLRADEPTVIGGYRLVGVIGAGGMGRVYLGIGPDGRLAAVKQVLSTLAEDPGFRARFAHEIEASRRVSGAYTAAVMDADPHADAPWLASVFVPGPSLHDAVSVHGPLPEPAVWRLAAGLVIALAEIHRVGLVHRDFKPANVLLTDDGPRVIDFGIARALHDAAPFTQTGAVVGSPGYMSPEQVEGRVLSAASDVFALGSVICFAATGSAPFGRGAPHALLYRVTSAEPDLTALPPRLRPLVAGCLAKRPEHRPIPQQVLQAIGPLAPTQDWLPPGIHAMVGDHAARARGLAGDPGRPVAAGPVTGHGPPAANLHPLQPPPGAGELTGRAQPLAAHAGPARSRTRWWIGGGIGVVTVVAALVAVLVLRPFDTPDPGSGGTAAAGAASTVLTVEQAAALLTELIPGPDTPPAGFVVSDAPETPEVDGAPTDPTQVDRSRTRFACDTQADPPTPAEAGILAATGSSFREDVGPQPDRFRDGIFFSLAYLDPTSRTDITREIRGRIGGCRTQIPVGFTAWRFSFNTVTGADENVGYIANQEPVDGYPDFQTLVGACEFARVDAIVIRACALISNDPADTAPGLDPTLAQDAILNVTTRALIEPLIQRARQLQTP